MIDMNADFAKWWLEKAAQPNGDANPFVQEQWRKVRQIAEAAWLAAWLAAVECEKRKCKQEGGMG